MCLNFFNTFLDFFSEISQAALHRTFQNPLNMGHFKMIKTEKRKKKKTKTLFRGISL